MNEFLYDSTMDGKWAFKPDYYPDVVPDKEIAARFEAMPDKAQALFKEIFQHNYESRGTLHDAVVDFANEEYDPQIEAAKKAGRMGEVKELEDAKARVLEQTSRVFDTQDAMPYTPVKREGKWAAVGKSREYLDAEEREDQKEMDRLRPDANHYIVAFRDSVGEADILEQNLRDHFGDDGYAAAFPRDQIPEGAINNKELYLTMDRMKKSVLGVLNPDSKLYGKINRLMTDYFLHSVSEGSARKGELHREGISAIDPTTGEVPDMMRAYYSRATANANYVSSMSSSREMNSAWIAASKEASRVPASMKKNMQRLYNEVAWRYANNLSFQPNRMVDKIVRGVSVWNLLSSPFYYLQNATQAVLISHPLLASMVGYGKASAHLAEAYAEWGRMTKDTGLLDRIDYGKADPKFKEVMDYLIAKGHLDAGYAGEHGNWEMNGNGLLPQAWNKTDRFLRMMPQRIEVMNRTVTGLAAYTSLIEKGMSPEAAMKAAGKLIDDSHGDYSGFNTPRAIQQFGNFGKVALQFRKFQLIMGGTVVKQFNMMFNGASNAEKAQGLKALTFLSAHLAAVGGVVGLPGAALLGPAIGLIQSKLDPEKDGRWHDWQEDLRLSLGAGGEGHKRDWFKDMLYKGAPYALLGMDTSDRLGMGNIAALAPYTDLPRALDSPAQFAETTGKMMLGPSGGILSNLVQGWGFGMEQGDWTRAAESFVPKGASNILQARRLLADGLTNKRGDVLIKPEDISGMDAFYTAIGVRPSHLVNQAETASALYDATQFYDQKSTGLRGQFAKAAKAHDTAKMAEVRQDWREMQQAQIKDKLKPDPFSSLIKSPQEQRKRERGTLGGVETTKQNRRFVANLLMANDLQEARQLEDEPY